MRGAASTSGNDNSAKPANDRAAWIVTVFCMLGLIYTSAGSSIGAGIFLAVWGLLAAARAQRSLQLLFRSPELWLFPAFALLSVLWSQAQIVTLRAAIELALTVGIALMTAGFLRPREFVSAMSVSLLCGALLSLIFGRDGVDGLTGATVFLGIFASKNTMALFMSFLAIFSMAVLGDRGQPALLRWLAVLSFLLSIPLLIRAHSVGAFLTTGASFMVFLLTSIVVRLKPQERLLLLAIAGACILPIIMVTALFAVEGALGEATTHFITGVLGKDATLTGRTVLWRIALTEIDKHPLLGVGYTAFWLQGNLLAEGIWRSFSIESRMGFHFHDTFLEVAVEVGWAGVAALLITLVLVVERSIRFAFADHSLATSCLVAVMFCLVTRTFDEVDAPYPFGLGTFLLFVIASYGADYVRGSRRKTRQFSTPIPQSPWNFLPDERPQITA